MSWLSTYLQGRGVSTESISGAAKQAAMNELRKYLQSIEISSNYSPPVVLNDPLKPGPPNPYLEKMQPQIKIRIKGINPLVIAPYGTPIPPKDISGAISQAIQTNPQLTHNISSKGGTVLTAISIGALIIKAFRAFK